MKVQIFQPARAAITPRFRTGHNVGQITRILAARENRDLELMHNQKMLGDHKGWQLTFQYLTNSLKSRWLAAMEEGNLKKVVYYESMLTNRDSYIRKAAVITLVGLINEKSDKRALDIFLKACKQKGRQNEVITSFTEIRNPIALKPVSNLLKWIYNHGGIEKSNIPQRALCDAAFKCIKNIIREGGTISIVRAILNQDLIIHEAGQALFKENKAIREEVLAFVETEQPQMRELLFSEQDAS